jgi:metallo-beta-lactamase class B
MFVSLSIAASLAAAAPATMSEWRTACEGKDGWSDPAPPIRIFGNVYDVGTCGIVALLIAGPRGHILLDAATAEAAPAVAANIERLGFSHRRQADRRKPRAFGPCWRDRRAAAPHRRPVMVRPPGFNSYETGVLNRQDPQSGLFPPYPGSKVGQLLSDGQVVRVGPLELTVHATPGTRRQHELDLAFVPGPALRRHGLRRQRHGGVGRPPLLGPSE